MTYLELFERNQNAEYQTYGAEKVDMAFEQEDDLLYIHFESSNQTQDWVNNFSYAARPYEGMAIKWKAHGGFLECWQAVKSIVLSHILPYKIKGIIITGYSHGGGLAMLCHEFCWFTRSDIRDNIHGFAFGTPRVYKGWFIKKELKKRWANFKVIRVHKDLVTHLPLTIMGFRHIYKPLTIGKFLKYNMIKAHTQNAYRLALAELE